MSQLIILRHGQSIWNLENKFTGWTNVELSSNGIKEAIIAGQEIKETGIDIDVAFTSVLKRAIDSLDVILNVLDKHRIPIHQSWRLNERHYGALQGLNKKETTLKFGDQQVNLWRRSYETLPPLLDLDDPRHPRFNTLYQGIKDLPSGESLHTCQLRVLPYWHTHIFPELKKGNNVLIVAHGNSLRSLMMYIEHLSKDEVLKLQLPTATPIIYDFDQHFIVRSKRILSL